MFDPSLALGDDLLTVLVFVLDPEAGALGLSWKMIKVKCFQILAVSLIYVDALHLVKNAELKLQHNVVLDWDQISCRNLEGLLGDITEVRKFRLHTLDSLLLCVLLCLAKGCGAV